MSTNRSKEPRSMMDMRCPRFWVVSVLAWDTLTSMDKCSTLRLRVIGLIEGFGETDSWSLSGSKPQSYIQVPTASGTGCAWVTGHLAPSPAAGYLGSWVHKYLVTFTLRAAGPGVLIRYQVLTAKIPCTGYPFPPTKG
jgi:hypothetical protein